MPPKKTKVPIHEKCDPIPVGTMIRTTNKREIVIGKEFAQGGFGRICDAKVVGHTEKYVIKLEPSGNGPLFTEMHVFQRILRPEMLESFQKKHKVSHLGLPSLIDAGMHDDIRYLVMPKYSFCLDQVFKESKAPMKLEHVTDVLKCISHALQYMHEKDYVHADIKAANIMMNNKRSFNEVYLIDFGLARKVGNVIEKEDKKKAHDGTALYTSVDAHRGYGFTFRGDVEILAHNSLFWLTNNLPWQDIIDEEATLKVKDSQLNDVRATKEKFISNMSTEIKKRIPDSTAANVVLMLYKASKIDINTKPNFDDIVKNLNIKGKKRSADIDSEEVVPPTPSGRRGRKPVVSAPNPPSEDEPSSTESKHVSDAEDVFVPPSTRRGRKAVTRKESSDEEVMPVSKNRKKKSESEVEEEAPPLRKPRVDPKASSTRRRVPKSDPEADKAPPSASRSTRTRNNSGAKANDIIPGLKTRNAGRVVLPSHTERSDEEETDEVPKLSNRPQQPTTPVRPASSMREKPSAPMKLLERSPINDSRYVTPSPRRYPVDTKSMPIEEKKPIFKPELLPDVSRDLPRLDYPRPQRPAYTNSSPAPPIFASNVVNHHPERFYREDKHLSPSRFQRQRENSPPESPEYRIKPIPKPTGCSIV